MVPTEDNDCLWRITVQLPLTQADRATTPYTGVYGAQATADGLFQFRYEIRLAAGDNENQSDPAASTVQGARVLIEGQTERVEHNLKIHYFHAFRPNNKFRRFKGWTLSNKTVFQQYVQHHIYRFQRGESVSQSVPIL
jgi:hypothetical protein